MNHISEKRLRLLKLLMEKEMTSSMDATVDASEDPEKDAPEKESPAKENITSNGKKLTALLKIKPTGSRPAMFCIHALLGSAFFYYKLSTRIEKEQPFYVFQSPNLDGNMPQLNRIEDIASLYIKEMRLVQPHGPYHLGGYSFGGWVAFEMAQQLIRAGEKVGLLAMFGTYAPISTMVYPPFFRAMNHIIDYYGAYNSTIARAFSSEEAILDKEAKQSSNSDSPVSDLVKAYSWASCLYMPIPYPGKITLFETIEQQLVYPFDYSRGWSSLSSEEIDRIPVNGNHLNMFFDPHLKGLSEKLNRSLMFANMEMQ